MTDKPSCTNCGACCLQMRSPPFIGDENSGWERVPQDLREEITEHIMSDAPPESPCLWLDLETRRCQHYDLRPQICRDFEVGEPACLRWRDVYGISGTATTSGPHQPSHGTMPT